ncbi:MAG: ApaG domain [Thiohalomonas sp.]|nr:ApaG domain [Thiohalomonas sp.]
MGHEYSSGTIIQTPVGSMQGSYQMKAGTARCSMLKSNHLR